MKKLIEECLTFIKKYFALAPLIGYQCVFYVVIICGIFLTEVIGVTFIREPFITLALIVLYILNTVITLVGVIVMGIFFKKSTYTKQEIMISNLVVKLFNFLLIIVDAVLIYMWELLNNYNVETRYIAICLVMIVTDVILTGIYYVICSKTLEKEGIILKNECTIGCICSFIIGADVIVSLNLIKKVSDKENLVNSISDKIRNFVKKSLIYIPLIIYPYMYVVFMMMFFNDVISWDTNEKIIVIYNIIILMIILINSIVVLRRRNDIIDVSVMNLVIKWAHVPAYLVNSLILLLGIGLGVFGGFLLIIYALPMLILPMIVSGLNSIACTIQLRKQNIISIAGMIFWGILNFVCIIDLLVATVYVIKVAKYKGKEVIHKILSQ